MTNEPKKVPDTDRLDIAKIHKDINQCQPLDSQPYGSQTLAKLRIIARRLAVALAAEYEREKEAACETEGELNND